MFISIDTIFFQGTHKNLNFKSPLVQLYKEFNCHKKLPKKLLATQEGNVNQDGKENDSIFFEIGRGN